MTDRALLMQAASWTPTQKALYSEIVRVFLARNPRGRRILAIDGRDGAGKSMLADALLVAFARADVAAYRASLDDFHRARAFRDRQGSTSPKGYYEDAFDIELLDRILLQPFRMGGSTGFVTHAFDVVEDREVEMEWKTAGPDAVLILDGEFLARPALRGKLHFLLRVEASDAERGARMHRRDGTHPLLTDPSHDRHRIAHERYEQTSDPVRSADMLVDTTDWREPRQLFADSC